MDLSFIFLILVPLTTAFLIPLVDIIYEKARKVLIIISVNLELILTFIILFRNFKSFKTGELDIVYQVGGWSSSLGVTLVLDNLSMIFSFLLSLSLFLIIFYSLGFIGDHEGKYYVLLFLLFAAMQGAVLTGDIFNLYVFIELITITSGALVAFHRYLDDSVAAFKYLVYGVIGGIFFLIGVFLIYFNIGTLNLSIIAENFANINSHMKISIILFFMVSILIKLGIFPFHFWLPKAHSVCPSSISAVLSGVLLKVFVYIFIRLFIGTFDFQYLINLNLNNFIIYLGLFSSLIGHMLAEQANGIKRMLAFSSVGHIGLIIAVLGLNTQLGVMAGIVHTISHLFLKVTLFISVGYILQYTEGHHLADFIGVAYKKKGVFIVFIIAAMGLVGVPPLPGFFSKYYIMQAFIEKGKYFPEFLIVFVSVVSFFYYLRYIFWGYNGEYVKKDSIQETILSNFYREKVVLSVIYSFLFLIMVTGVFWSNKFWILPFVNIFGG